MRMPCAAHFGKHGQKLQAQSSNLQGSSNFKMKIPTVADHGFWGLALYNSLEL
jgi:hypothetical protein